MGAVGDFLLTWTTSGDKVRGGWFSVSSGKVVVRVTGAESTTTV
jgi:hypothetical protein